MIAINDSLIIDANNSFEESSSDEDKSSTSSSNELDSNAITEDSFFRNNNNDNTIGEGIVPYVSVISCGIDAIDNDAQRFQTMYESFNYRAILRISSKFLFNNYLRMLKKNVAINPPKQYSFLIILLIQVRAL